MAKLIAASLLGCLSLTAPGTPLNQRDVSRADYGDKWRLTVDRGNGRMPGRQRDRARRSPGPTAVLDHPSHSAVMCTPFVEMQLRVEEIGHRKDYNLCMAATAKLHGRT